ncbi:MAG: sigma-70 family RNA polymerase sigma factor [Rubripirellula sp.]|nr:sigma-70 family RNA polymerase sigma factor [Rubripirellula sp.]
MLKPSPQRNPSGDQKVCEYTLRSLFDEQETPLLHYAYSLIGRRAVAEEIVQEVFLQLHVRWDNVDSPKAWLFQSVRYRAFNYLRDNRKETLSNHQEEAASNMDLQSPETALMRMEATGTLRKCLEELSDSDRQLVKLKYFDGLKYRDISEQTGLSIGNVGYRLHHILKELAQKLSPLGMDNLS